MTRPNILVRLIGSPLGTLALLSGCAFFIYGWYKGHTVWWVVLLALGVAYRTLQAFGQMRSYKAWAADRQALRAEVDGLALPKKSARGNVLIALVIFLAIAAYFGQPKTDGGLTSYELLREVLGFVLAAASAYLGWKFISFFGRKAYGLVADRKGRQASTGKVETDLPVSWIIGRASSSPSRVQAQKALPDYCARLLTQENSRLETPPRADRISAH